MTQESHMNLRLEKQYRIENCQGFCWVHIRRRVYFLLLPSKIIIPSQRFGVEAWQPNQLHF